MKPSEGRGTATEPASPSSETWPGSAGGCSWPIEPLRLIAIAFPPWSEFHVRADAADQDRTSIRIVCRSVHVLKVGAGTTPSRFASGGEPHASPGGFAQRAPVRQP